MNLFDTTGKENRTRHEGIENAIKIPNGNSELNSKIIATKCGKFLRNVWRADDVSYFDADGNLWSTPCAKCLPEKHQELVK